MKLGSHATVSLTNLSCLSVLQAHKVVGGLASRVVVERIVDDQLPSSTVGLEAAESGSDCGVTDVAENHVHLALLTAPDVRQRVFAADGTSRRSHRSSRDKKLAEKAASVGGRVLGVDVDKDRVEVDAGQRQVDDRVGALSRR